MLILYSTAKVILIISFACQMAKSANSPKDRRHAAVPWDSIFISVNSAAAQLSQADWRVIGRKLTYRACDSS